MRVAGYVREPISPDTERTAFMQAERIRMWVARNGYHMVAVCQDLGSAIDPLDREGYRALLGILDAGNVDTVVVPSLSVLSSDKIRQEVMLWDLRSRGVRVASADEADMEDLADPTADPARAIIRDILVRRHQYDRRFGPRSGSPLIPLPTRSEGPDDGADVLIELIPDRAEARVS